MGIEELHQVTPGQTLGDISVKLSNGDTRTVCTLKEGILPSGSDLAAEDTRAFFALDPDNGIGQAVVAVEQHEPQGEAIIGIEPLSKEAEHNILLLRGLVKIALEESETTEVTLNPECADALGDQVVSRIGFIATGSGSLVFQAAAPAESSQMPVAA